jgi:hypothetical protein
MLRNFVNGADIGMIQRRSGASFAQEALIDLLILGDVLGEEFEGDKAAQRGVLGLVNHTHAAATQLLQNAVMGNGLA